MQLKAYLLIQVIAVCSLLGPSVHMFDVSNLSILERTTKGRTRRFGRTEEALEEGRSWKQERHNGTCPKPWICKET